MYVCKDCGQEFKIKPDFCDCGNDTFEEVVEEKKPSLIEKYEINPFALMFFIGCLVLSVLTLMFFANPKPQTETTKPQLVKSTQHIPNIDNIWDNTPIKPTQEEVKVVEEPQPIIQNLQNIFKPTPKSVVKTEKKPVVQTNQTKTTTTKTITTEVKTEPPKPVVTQTQTQTVVKTTANNETTSKEVFNYKLRLRNSLFSRLNYSAIQGAGKCGIQFAVNSEGKLINRGFTYQSDNKSLNDEIYKMLMRMPVFDIPPKGYNGELIKISFEFDNGSYEIRLLN